MEQDPPVEHQLQVTLEQILNGVNKKVKIKRLVIDPDGSQRIEEKMMKIDVKPGILAGERITFPREGDQHLGRIPADLVFVVQDKPHKIFMRKDTDLECSVQVSESQLSNGGKLQIPTLNPNDGPKYLSLDGLDKKKMRRFPNLGLPLAANPSKRGNLIVHIDVVEGKTSLSLRICTMAY